MTSWSGRQQESLDLEVTFEPIDPSHPVSYPTIGLPILINATTYVDLVHSAELRKVRLPADASTLDDIRARGGPGFFTVPAARIVGDGGTILALDINPVAVEHVRHKIEEAGMTNAKVIVANAAQTDLPDRSSDLIFVFGFARAVGGMAAIWPELHRLLKPGETLSVEGRLRPPGRLFEAGRRQGRIAQLRKLGER